MKKCKSCGQWAIIGDECNVCACARLLDERKRKREDAAADAFGADDADRERESRKNFGKIGQRDEEWRPI